jgi:recombinational DNA repair ATPase RecF
MAAKNQPAAECSTGEQKAMLIAITLAHADLRRSRRIGPTPPACCCWTWRSRAP